MFEIQKKEAPTNPTRKNALSGEFQAELFRKKSW